MTTYVYRNGELVEKEKAEPLFPAGPATYYISDNIDHTWHPANGKYYDSKSNFRKTTKAYGCREIGDQVGYGKREFIPKLDNRQRREDIHKAIYQLKNGRRP
jgi:hypothetical protein